MTHDAALDELLQKVWNGRRIGPTEASRLYRQGCDGADAQARRHAVRFHRLVVA